MYALNVILDRKGLGYPVLKTALRLCHHGPMTILAGMWASTQVPSQRSANWTQSWPWALCISKDCLNLSLDPELFLGFKQNLFWIFKIHLSLSRSTDFWILSPTPKGQECLPLGISTWTALSWARSLDKSSLSCRLDEKHVDKAAWSPPALILEDI